MTLEDIENDARGYIRDTIEPQRFAPSEIFSAVREAMDALASDRPESRYVSGNITGGGLLLPDGSEAGFPVPASFPATVGGASITISQYRALRLNMADKWRAAVTYYAVHLLYLRDDPDTGNTAQSQAFLAKYAQVAGT